MTYNEKLCLIEKEEVKLSLLIDDMILYIEIPKNTSKNDWKSVNLVKLQDIKLICRNMFSFCTLTMNYLKEKLRKNPT